MILFLIVLHISFLLSTVTDIEGNIYETIYIGEQHWMKENLKTTIYNDGYDINFITDDDFSSEGLWYNLDSGAYAEYDNDYYNVQEYGRLYNWFAVNDDRGICPLGWHVPSEDDINQLMFYLQGTQVAGGKMKEIGYEHWEYPNAGATNSSDFTALPGGFKSAYGSYIEEGLGAHFWLSEDSDDLASRISIWFDSAVVLYSEVDKHNGFSVRCIEDPNIEGCMDSEACNFNPEAMNDNGSCYYPEFNYNCNGDCTVEVDCLGVCGGDAIVDVCGVCNGGNTFCSEEGCTDPLASNYQPFHIYDDGSCINSPVNAEDFTYYGSFGGSMYYLSKTSNLWHYAKNICEDSGGHLATVTSHEENMYLANINFECTDCISSFSTSLWLGGVYDEYWTWLNGEEFNYNNWQIGEGDDGILNRAIVMNYAYGIYLDHELGQWSDDTRNQFVMYVLEIESECIDVDEDDICDDVDECVGYYDECGYCNGDGLDCQISGDLNFDGDINVVDVVLLVNLILVLDYNHLGDINNDGLINVVDVVLLVSNIIN